MNRKAKDGTQILLRKFTISEANNLSIYLNHLSPESKHRFGPHPYDVDSIYTLFNQSDSYVGYIAQEKTQEKIVSYSLIKHGYLEHDKFRLESYGLELDKDSDCTFAPSVSDEYQNKGIGKLMFDYIVGDLQAINKKRIILWGGVQATNESAFAFYVKLGFTVLGKFEHNGYNYDMLFDIN